jgi:hypothetical protein
MNAVDGDNPTAAAFCGGQPYIARQRVSSATARDPATTAKRNHSHALSCTYAR